MKTLAVLLLLCLLPITRAEFLLKPGEQIVFLGDSITQNGKYIAFIDAWLRANKQDARYPIINLGLSSETASGLSEPDHPWPRPCIHDRLEKALTLSKPRLVIACYGMNDGIYYPFGSERFKAYRDGIHRLIDQCRAAGARVVLLTPPPFDAPSKKGKLFPAGLEKYSYKQVYEGYDLVLKSYAAWIKAQQGARLAAVIDLHTPMTEALAKIRQTDPEYTSGDGIHPNAEGHRVMAETILRGLGAGEADLSSYTAKDAPAWVGLCVQRTNILSAAWRNRVGHARSKPAKEGAFEAAVRKAAELDTRIKAALGQP